MTSDRGEMYLLVSMLIKIQADLTYQKIAIQVLTESIAVQSGLPIEKINAEIQSRAAKALMRNETIFQELLKKMGTGPERPITLDELLREMEGDDPESDPS